MQARGPLMREHRLIERLIATLEQRLAAIEESRDLDPALIDAAVDFIRTYADRTHHGKEEEIFFVELAARELSAEDRRLMEELVVDHAYARTVTARLAAANARYRAGEILALDGVAAHLHTLCEFYPRHIAKEDKTFFPAVRAYLSEDEERSLLERFREFDRLMIHEKYAAVVAGLETR